VYSVCQGLRKPNNLPYREFTEESCQILAQSTVTETDYLIPYFVRLQKFAEDVNQAFDFDHHCGLPELDSIRIEILSKTFNEQLKSFETTFPPELWNNGKPQPPPNPPRI
jgi:hypothetical protein